MKVIKLKDHTWILKADWDACNKFEEEQKIKLHEFMFKQYKNIKWK